MKDFRIVARIYNNRLRERREATGMTACAFARSIGVSPTVQCELEALKISPLRKDGTWTRTARRIAEALGVDPSALWTDAARQIRARIVERRLDAEEVAALSSPESAATPFGLLAAVEERAAIADAMQVLTPREQQVIRQRFGLDDGHERTFLEVGEDVGVSRERIRQIETKALRKLRKVLPTEGA